VEVPIYYTVTPSSLFKGFKWSP